MKTIPILCLLMLLMGMAVLPTVAAEAERAHPFYTDGVRIRIGRILSAEMTTGAANGAKPFLKLYSNFPEEQKVKLGNTEVISEFTKPAYVAISFVPDPQRSLTLYDYQLECFGKYYRCVGLQENWDNQAASFKLMNEKKVYTMYFVIEYPGYSSDQVPMTLEWKLDASGKERSTISIVNCQDAALTPPQELVKHIGDYRKFLAGEANIVTVAEPVQSIAFANSRGNDVMDAQGKRIGLLINNARIVDGGRKGKCLDLTNGYVQINPGTMRYGGANLGQNFSLVLWVRAPSELTNENVTIYAHGEKAEGVNSVNIKFKGGLLLAKVNGSRAISDDKALSIPANFVADNQWHMITVTHSPNEQRLYLDGEEHGKRSLSKESMGDIRQPLILGMNSALESGSHYRGRIDRIMTYDFALSADEVKAVLKK